MLEGASKNGQSRETGNTAYTRQTKPKTIFHLFIEMVKSTSVLNTSLLNISELSNFTFGYLV